MTDRLRLVRGDCVAAMAAMAPDSVDAVVTDPPYHLVSIVKRFGAPGAKATKAEDAYKRAAAGFMGQAWDGGDVAFRPETWAAALRVLKPGGHLIAFAATRTYHRLACAVEDAGFEVRDMVAWLYGSGFPKSLDVAKAIEKRRDDRADVLRVTAYLRAARDAAGWSNAQIDAAFGLNGMAGHWTSAASQPAVPTLAQWAELRRLLAMGDAMDAEVARLNARKGDTGEAWKARDVVGDVTPWAERVNYAMTTRDGLARGPAVTAAAQAWEGWGTALKPALEPCVLARKPLTESSVAAQVLATRTGAVNVDATRLDGGRWPANVAHDGSAEACAGFPVDPTGDSAARYFYSAKADAADRRGSDHPTVKPVELMRWLVRMVTPPGGVVLDPFAGTGTTLLAAHAEGCAAIGCEAEPRFQADVARAIATAMGRPDEAEAAYRAEIGALLATETDADAAARLRARLRRDFRGGRKKPPAPDAGPLFGV